MDWNDFSFCIRHFTNSEQESIRRAFELGKKAHDGQLRKSGEPYFTHPIAVAQILASWGADIDTIIAGLLHDTVEDTDVTLDEIDRLFDGSTRLLIDGVTKLQKEDIGSKPSLDKKIETLRKIFGLLEEDVRIVIIKLADRLHNMRTSNALSLEKQRALAQETMDFYVKIANRLSLADVEYELEALCIEILDAEEYKVLSALRTENDALALVVLKDIQQQIAEKKLDYWNGIHMEAETKKWDRLRKQLHLDGGAVTGLSSAIIVCICPDIDTCYRALGTMHQLWKRETLSFEDYINSPMINGYRALHTTVILGNGKRVRCKIRTADMQKYAHRGVTTVCFDQDRKGFSDHLSWMKNIRSLAADSRERSGDFWESLQSDILGEYITIHGPADEFVNLPKDATALDGIFYLFGEQALRAVSVRVNGKQIAFDTPLKHGDSVTGIFADHAGDTRQWLDWAHTGTAAAIIRKSLATLSKKKKIHIGKNMLEAVMMERKMGLVDEFDESKLLPGIARLGYGSLNETFIAIANGGVNPYDVFQSVFQRVPRKTRKPQSFIVRYAINLQNDATLDRISEIHKKYIVASDEIQYRRTKDAEYTVLLRCQMPVQERENFLQDLKATGAKNIRMHSPFYRASYVGLLLSLIILWGLDPVFSRLLIQTTIAPFPLAFLRFSTAFIAATFSYGIQTVTTQKQLRPLSPLQPSLLLAGVSLCTTGILTYFALSSIPATQYILWILLVQLATAALRNGKSGHISAKLVVSFLFACAALVLSFLQYPFMPEGSIMGFAAACSFTFYSQVSERYQLTIIRARYPAYLFWVSIVALILSMLLIPFFHLPALDVVPLALLACFSLLFSFIPYILYFESMRRMGRSFLDKLLPITCLVTFAAETLITQTFSLSLSLAFCCTALAIHQFGKSSRDS